MLNLKWITLELREDLEYDLDGSLISYRYCAEASQLSYTRLSKNCAEEFAFKHLMNEQGISSIYIKMISAARQEITNLSGRFTPYITRANVWILNPTLA